MIYVDPRTGSKELFPILKRLGAPCEKDTELPYGDFAFEGRGPDGNLAVGIERKTLHDILQCIDDSRYNMQRIGMKQLYNISILMVEGHWKPHDAQGFLMEGFNGGVTWGFCRYRSQRSMYSKLKRYLMSVTLSGVIVDYTRDPFHSAFNVSEWFHYFQKKEHTSLMEIQKIAIPTLNARPSLVRKWANDIDGIGTKMSADAERIFKTPITLAQADESDWLRVPGVGVKTARDIVQQVWGRRR